MLGRKYFCQETETDYLIVEHSLPNELQLALGIYETGSTHFAMLNARQIDNLITLLQLFLKNTVVTEGKTLWEDSDEPLF